MQHIKTVCLVWNKAALLVKHILASTRAGISKTPADKSTTADMQECRWHTCHICTQMAAQELICRLQLPWHSPGICCKTLASLNYACDGIPTESVHKLRSAVAMVSPRHLQDAAAMASPQQLQQNSGLGQLQLRWHPHRICTSKLTSNRCDGIPTASAGCSLPWHTHSSCTTS